MRRLTALVVWGVVLTGLMAAFLALHDHGGEEVFSDQQAGLQRLKQPLVLSAAHVEAFVSRAPEPVSPAERTPAVQVRCRPGSGGTLRNPWSCLIRYRSGKQAHYRVIVQPDGRYSGVGTGIISGCCIKTPTLD